MFPELKEKLDEVSLLFHKAEKKMKYVELLGEGLSIPAINELRYAGCHIARAWGDQVEDKKALEEANRAIKHVKRANYDACEIGILYYLEYLRQFQEDYRLVEIPTIFPGYLDLCKFSDDVKEMVISSDKDTRGELWESFWEKFLEMEDNFRKLKHARIELNKKLEEIKSVEQDRINGRKRHIQRMVITAAAIVISVILWFYNNNSSSKATSSPKEVIDTQTTQSVKSQ